MSDEPIVNPDEMAKPAVEGAVPAAEETAEVETEEAPAEEAEVTE